VKLVLEAAGRLGEAVEVTVVVTTPCDPEFVMVEVIVFVTVFWVCDGPTAIPAK
jgi:hypothetical protein